MPPPPATGPQILTPEVSIGGNGSLIWSGMPDNAELHPELRNFWYKTRVYREMLDNSPLVARAVSDLVFMLLAGTISVVPAKTERGAEAADLVRSNLDHMETPLSDVFQDQITAVFWGWNVSEVIWKQTPEGLALSRIEQRPQWTLYGWLVSTDDTGRKTYSMIQQMLDGAMATIPAAKCVHITMGQGTGGPEGRAALRHVYIPYRDSRDLNQTMKIGFQASMVGVLVLWPPAEAVAADSGTPEYDAVSAAQQDLARAVRGERTSITIPGVDNKGQKTWDLTRIQSTSGAETANAIALSDRYSQQILMALWAGFQSLGQAGSKGASAAHTDGLIDVTQAVFSGIASSIMDGLKTQVTDVLCAVRGYDPEDCPTLTWSANKNLDLPSFWNALAQSVKAGFITPNPDGSDENPARALFGLPPKPEPAPPPVAE